MKHIIGIDFGTSTSMIKTALRDGKSDTLETKSVTFTQNGYSSVPTLIQKKGDAVWYGWDVGQDKGLDALLYRNFKLSLRSENPQERREAVELLEEFFRYLYQSYAEQKNFLPGSAEEIETVVSYPAQWSREQQELVINAAKKAGFPNVSGMDEPSAAVNCILKAKQKDIEKAGILYAGKPLNILVVDMGAGTTDLAFVTVTVENGKLQTVIRGTWPEAGSHVIYGGSQMDLRLEEMMRTWLTDSGVPETMVQNLITMHRSNIKSWKENTLSALLAKNMTAAEFSAITNFLLMMGMTAKPFPAINKDSFADLFRPELENFVKVISSVPQNFQDEAELVILTGGNSEWFWIPDVMLGNDTRFGDVGLKNIRSNPDRLIRMEQPAETVSRGLVYDQNNISISRILMGPKYSIDSFNREIEHNIEHKKDSVVRYHSKPFTVNVLEVQWDDSKGLWYAAIPCPQGKLREGQTIQILKEYSRLKLSCKLQSLVLANEDILRFAMKPEGDARIQVGDPLRYFADIPEGTIKQDSSIAEGKCGDNAYWKLYEDGKLYIYGTGKMNSYTWITYNSTTTGVNTPWHFYREKISSIVVDYGITYIGRLAFSECSCAKTATLPEGTDTIDYHAFGGCTSLRELKLPQSVKKLIGRPFPSSCKVARASTEDSGREIWAMGICGADAYWILYEDGELYIYGTGKMNDYEWKIRNLFSSVTNTPWSDYQKRITSIVIADGITYLGKYAFLYCNCVKTVSLPESLEAIGADAFMNCSSLSNLELPKSVKTLMGHPFPDSCKVVRASSEDSGREIWSLGICGEDAHWKLYKDGELYIYGKGRMNDYDSDRFLSATYSPWWYDTGKITSVNISEGITHIGKYNFYQCSKVKTVTLPNSLETIGACAFYAKAQCNLGLFYYKGEGVAKDYDEAVKWYRKAAEQGYANGQAGLGLCYYEGKGVARDYDEAVKWYRKAAEQGYANGQASLGLCYYEGKGVARDYDEAVKWYHTAAEQGNAYGQNGLGLCFKEGKGVVQDYGEAVRWYRKAADQGIPVAYYNLGLCYEDGKGVEKSRDEAAKLYQKAIDGGYSPAKGALTRVNSKLLSWLLS